MTGSSPTSVRRKFTKLEHSIKASYCSGHRRRKLKGSSIRRTSTFPGATVTEERPSVGVSTDVMQSIHASMLQP